MKQQLTQEQIDQYRTQGYVVVESLFDAKDIKRVDETIRTLTKEAIASGDYAHILELEPELLDDEPVARRIYNPLHQHQDFRDLACAPKLLDRIESLIGPDFGIHHSKLNMKPGKVGSVVHWHQDLAYFPHTNDDLVTTLVYLDDATEENGCLQVLPGHHNHFFRHQTPDGSFGGMITEPISEEEHGPAVSLPAPAGSVIFMHCILPHSSLPNQSEKPRRTLIFEFRAADSFPIYYSDRVGKSENLAVHVRGEKPEFARFGGPAPFIPKLSEHVKSLYELQAETLAARG